MSRPAAGGGRWVEVDPERLGRWVGGFADRHGPVEAAATAEQVRLVAADGARAELVVPFPPLPTTGDPVAALVAHACTDRRVGVLLARRGGHAAGVFEGGRLVSGKAGSRPVHGRAAAGGWSQQRFARRREGQVRVALAAAADLAAAVLAPQAARLDAVVIGGDRGAVEAVLGDPRLAALRPLVTGSLLEVPDPRRQVLLGAPRLFRRVRIRVVDPPSG